MSAAEPEARKRARDRERTRLVLARSDMKQAAVAAQYLWEHGHELNGNVERVMWTGVVVTYARPFSRRNNLHPISGPLAHLDKPMDISLHARLCELRDELFAHNDVTELRGAIEASEWYQDMNKGALRDVADLARLFERRFAEQLRQIEAED